MNDANESRRTQCVREILNDMCKGTWRRGASHLHYEEKYKFSASMVRDCAANANRFLKMCAGNEEEIRTEIIAGIADARKRCIKAVETRVSNDGKEVVITRTDLKAYIASWELYARVYGLLDPKKDDSNQPTEEVDLNELVDLLQRNGFDVRRKDGASATGTVSVESEYGSGHSEGAGTDGVGGESWPIVAEPDAGAIASDASEHGSVDAQGRAVGETQGPPSPTAETERPPRE